MGFLPRAQRLCFRRFNNSEARSIKQRVTTRPQATNESGSRSERGRDRSSELALIRVRLPVPSIYSSARTELAKLLMYGLFRKIRVLAQDAVRQNAFDGSLRLEFL